MTSKIRCIHARGIFFKLTSLVMDDHESQPHPRSSGLRVSTKSKAPSPPGLKRPDSPGFSQFYPGNHHFTMDQKENLNDKNLSLHVVLPGGVEKMTVVHGSQPLMDLLVTLCAKYHLNPSSHTLELVTANRNSVKLKPNTLIGTVDAEKIILKPKGEDKNKKTGPQMPEATVRMVINYKKTQKTILRVNPRVPLAELLPAICEKCEFDMESTVLLRDVQSLAPLDLSSSLNDYAIRELYARDTKGQPDSPVCPASTSQAGTVQPGKDKTQKEKENKGLFSLFRKSKKKSDQATAASAPASPVLVSKPRPRSMALPSTNSSPLSSPTISMDMPKKRRAPQPPVFVSQSCPSDPSARRRLYSEPVSQLDRDQVSRLSRGSSAESSLKRTKRKAPPPPASPSAVVQETVPLDQSLQGDTAANTLEEIMEQEEVTPSVMSATASDTQGEDGSLSMSADASLHSPSPDTEILSTMSVEGNGEDLACDMSSDGNEQQSTVNEFVTLGDVRTTAGTDSSKLEVTSSGPCQVENVSQQPICERSTTESAEGDCSTVPSSPHQPVMQDAEGQACVQENTEPLQEQAVRLESAVATNTSCPAGEVAQVQTDFALPVSLPQQMDKVPFADNATALESAGKKDMATLTEELNPPDFRHVFSHTSETSSCQHSIPSAPATTKAPCVYATDSEPKPKPSNELTRDYIPKVGMTTYTIVPQKSLEKQRYFEVALTLEKPPVAPEEGLNIGSLQLEESTAPRRQMEASEEKSELHSTIPREDLLSSTATNHDTVNGCIPESTHFASPTSLPKADEKISFSANGTFQVGSPAEVKEVKIPPATKPKPGSFRFAQHKKPSGYYVTSAAVKSFAQREGQENAERAKLSPPPMQCWEETTGAANIQFCPTRDDRGIAIKQITRQSSLPCKEPSAGLSLEKLRSFAAPRPYSPTTPSRFAQAVSSAVRRSQSLYHGPKSPHSPVSPPLSPITTCSSVIESKGLTNLKVSSESKVLHD
uniref:Cordon-bleu ubiquitin-like domain-containing protein n=1 Tax=Monopterus albus TaxID=43700 RepID=A0A3Q3QX40_MONAL